MIHMITEKGSEINNSIFKKIVVATDGSESAKRAVDTAIEIARINEGKLYAIQVISMFFSMTLPTDAQWKETFQQRFMTKAKKQQLVLKTPEWLEMSRLNL